MDIEINLKESLRIGDRNIKSVNITLSEKREETKICNIETIIEIFNMCHNATNQKEGRESLDKSIYQERRILQGKKVIPLNIITLHTSNDNPVDLTIEFKGKKDKSQPILIFSVNKYDFIRDSSSFIYFYRKGIYQEILSFI